MRAFAFAFLFLLTAYSGFSQSLPANTTSENSAFARSIIGTPHE